MQFRIASYLQNITWLSPCVLFFNGGCREGGKRSYFRRERWFVSFIYIEYSKWIVCISRLIINIDVYFLKLRHYALQMTIQMGGGLSFTVLLVPSVSRPSLYLYSVSTLLWIGKSRHWNSQKSKFQHLFMRLYIFNDYKCMWHFNIDLF